MKPHSIKIEAIKVDTPDGICPGMAKTRQGESYSMDGRTPENAGMCANAFCALANQAYVMRVTDQMEGEEDGAVQRFCPHGAVTFRLSRTQEGKQQPFNTK